MKHIFKEGLFSGMQYIGSRTFKPGDEVTEGVEVKRTATYYNQYTDEWSELWFRSGESLQTAIDRYTKSGLGLIRIVLTDATDAGKEREFIALIKSKPRKVHVIQVFVDWECSSCGHENYVNYIEEDDLTGDQIETCKNCRTNNDILLKDIYRNEA